jgi:hypothetical protein
MVEGSMKESYIDEDNSGDLAKLIYSELGE